MRKILFLLWLVFACLRVSAYDYQAVYSHNTAYYKNGYNYIAPMRIDSIKVIGGDSIFYPFKSIREETHYCFTPYGASWLGGKIIVNKDYNYFFNKNGDSILIRTSAAVDESWTVYQKNDLIITGKVDSISEESFLGIIDSVKHISLSVSDAGITKYKNPVLISKKYGFLKTYGYYAFPNIEYGYYFADDIIHSTNFTLAGITSPKLGIQNLTTFEIYDFQPEDELHIKYEYDCIGPNYSNFKPIRIKTILRYISRADYPDSIVYQLLKKVDNNGVVSETVQKQKVVKDYHLEKLPLEPIFYQDGAFSIMMRVGSINHKFMSSLSRLHKIDNSAVETICCGGGDCWSMPTSDGCFPEQIYIEGLGGPYRRCEGWGCYLDEGLVYFKKEETEWGTPLIISSTPKVKNETGALFPNPAKDIVTLSLPMVSRNLSLTIIDNLGRIVKSASFKDTDKAALNIEELGAGLYFLQLTVDGRRESYKLFKE